MFAALFNWFKSIFRSKPNPIKTENEIGNEEEEVVDETIETPPVYEKRKRALLVGINKYKMPGSDLSGCVNDVWDMYDLLTKNYGFKPDDVRVVVDERATFENVQDRIDWLIEVTKAGDESVYYHSGHGSKIRDRNGDELSDGLDECLIMHDHDWDKPFIDDILYDIFKRLNKEAFLTVICDTCYSGTMTRGLKTASMNPSEKAYCRDKYLAPPFDILCRSLNRDLKVKAFGAKDGESEEQRHILLSGSKEDETSKELRYGGEIRGAMTFNLTRLLRIAPDQTWTQIHSSVHKSVQSMQNPVLRGMQYLKDRIAFGGEKL